MKLALVLGSQGEKLKPRLENIKDSLDIECYVSVPMFIDSSLKRDLIFDRVVILSTLVNDTAIRDLVRFWKNRCRQSEFIFLCRENTDTELAKNILNQFMSAKISTMLVSNTTIQILSEAILLSPQKITEKYGIEKYLSVEIDEGTDKMFESPEKPVEEPVQPQVQPQQEQSQKHQKHQKKSFLGGIFGTRRKDIPAKTHAPQVQTPSHQAPVTPAPVEGVSQDIEFGCVEQKAPEFGGSESKVEAQTPVQEPTSEMVFGESTPAEETPTSPDVKMESESRHDLGASEPSTEEGVFNGDVASDSSLVFSIEEAQKHSEEPAYQSAIRHENQKANSTSSSPTGFQIFEEDENEFEPDAIDEDYGDVTFSMPEQNYSRRNMYNDMNEVNEEEESLVGAEENYRKQNPNVVVKTVTKEVTRYVGGTVTTALNGILNGRLHKTIIVTGDRGSGVTTTAYMLAKKFAEKVPVLYFDCDIDRHGILSYISYETFRAYDRTMTEGIKRCRDSSIFGNCVVQYDTNLDILTSDYSCDADDVDIQKAHNVVAENAMNYGIVIVDCPVSKLHLIPDLILTGNTVVCMECSKRGVMNMLCGLEGSPLELRYKRCIMSRGTLIATKLNKQIKSQMVIDYADTIFADSGCNWLQMERKDFDGKLTQELLAQIVEG